MKVSQPRRPVLVAMGTRPEVVKLFPVARALARSPTCRPVVCAAGQHRELLDQALEDLGLVPDLRLDVMGAGQAPVDVAARLLAALPAVFDQVQPAVVVVQGDTTTALATGLAATYHGVPVAHVEAGLRTGDLKSPFPEEANRRMLAALSSLHFAPTPLARRNLLDEGVADAYIWTTGNTGIDTLHHMLHAGGCGHRPATEPCGDRPQVLVTAHRRESIGAGMAAIAGAVLTLARRHPGVDFTWPIHLNPQVQLALSELRTHTLANLHVREPLPYREFVRRLAGATLVLTDSGGIQEEAPALGVPVVVLGPTTAREEGLRHGVARTAELAHDAIVEAAEAALDRRSHPPVERTLYGDGRAAERIATVLTERIGTVWAAAG